MPDCEVDCAASGHGQTDLHGDRTIKELDWRFVIDSSQAVNTQQLRRRRPCLQPCKSFLLVSTQQHLSRDSVDVFQASCHTEVMVSRPFGLGVSFDLSRRVVSQGVVSAYHSNAHPLQPHHIDLGHYDIWKSGFTFHLLLSTLS
jgi:hypothetical protein